MNRFFYLLICSFFLTGCNVGIVGIDPTSPNNPSPKEGLIKTAEGVQPQSKLQCAPHTILDPGIAEVLEDKKPGSLLKVEFTPNSKEIVVEWQGKSLGSPVKVQWWEFEKQLRPKKWVATEVNQRPLITTFALTSLDDHIAIARDTFVRLMRTGDNLWWSEPVEVNKTIGSQDPSSINRLQFHPNISTRLYAQTCFGSTRIVEVDMDKKKVIRFYDLNENLGRPIGNEKPAQSCRVSNFSLSRDAHRIAAYVLGKLRVWYLTNHTLDFEVNKRQGNFQGVLFKPSLNGDTLATWDKEVMTIYRFDNSGGRKSQNISIPKGIYDEFYKGPSSNLAAWHPKQSTMIYVGKGNQIFTISQSSDQWAVKPFGTLNINQQEFVYGVKFSPNGQWLAFRTFKKVHIWKCGMKP